jgi:hypothetical protein
MADALVEIRGEIPREHVDVIDAVAMATPGASRMSVLREIVAQWCERELHRATMVYRVAGCNGSLPEARRSLTGSATAADRRLAE